jgi:hypothetical protein
VPGTHGLKADLQAVAEAVRAWLADAVSRASAASRP